MSDSTVDTTETTPKSGGAPVQILQPVPDEKNLLSPSGDSAAGGCCGGSCHV